MNTSVAPNPTNRKSPWHRKLSVRVALPMAVVMLLFDQLGHHIYDLGFRMFGMPEASIFVMSDDWVIHDLLTDGKTVRPGRVEPDAEHIAAMEASLSEEGIAFAWLDTDGEVIAAASTLPVRVGEPWPYALERTGKMPLDAAENTQLPATGLTIALPVADDGVALGTLVQVLFDPQTHADFHGVAVDEWNTLDDCEFAAIEDAALMTEEEEAEWTERESLSATITSVVIAALIALLLAWFVALFVTRRLTRLAALAANPVDRDGALPGPFVGVGSDEIGSLADSLNSMRARVSELVQNVESKDAARREWVAQVSHDIRTPLTALLACLDRAELVMRTEDIEILRRDARELISVARLDAERVNALAEDLLEIARLDAGDELTLEPVPPGELVRGTLTSLKPLAMERGVELRPEVPSGLPILQADGRRLTRALENLIRNAIQFANRTVITTISTEAGALRLCVEDDGPGLSGDGREVHVQELHQRRSRADSAGLGLQVARRVAEAHGGQLGAENVPGGGAAIWIRVPLPDHEEP